MSDLLVTGARGFVGRHVTARAVARGIDVAATEGDLRDPRSAAAAVGAHRPRGVVHLAGRSIADRRDDPWGALADDLRMVDNVLRAVADQAPDACVVIAGSAGQYGRGLPRPLREDDPTAPLTPYAAAKDLVERAALSPALRRDVRVIAARAFNHCGPGQGLDAPAAQWAHQLAAARRNGGGVVRTGDLSVRRDFLDVRDVADAYLALVFDAPDAQGAINVCSGEPVELIRVIEHLVAAAGVEVRVERNPALVRPNDPPFVVGDPARLRGLTGWKPRIPLAESLADQLAEQLAVLETTTAS